MKVYLTKITEALNLADDPIDRYVCREIIREAIWNTYNEKRGCIRLDGDWLATLRLLTPEIEQYLYIGKLPPLLSQVRRVEQSIRQRGPLWRRPRRRKTVQKSRIQFEGNRMWL